MSHPSMQAARMLGRLKGFQSWIGSHGTHVAELLLQVAPEAELYVAKISNTKVIPEKDTELIVKASLPR